MRSVGGSGLAEPVHFVAAVGRVAVAERGEWLRARARGLEARYADEDVDDRLRVQAGYCCASGVVDAGDDVASDRGLQLGALALEARGPRGVVGDDLDRFVVGHSSLFVEVL